MIFLILSLHCDFNKPGEVDIYMMKYGGIEFKSLASQLQIYWFLFQINFPIGIAIISFKLRITF